jgi:exopolysaccharide production protein ExoZ
VSRILSHPPPAGTAGPKLYSIQYLRALAASAVVVYHASKALAGHEEHVIDLGYGTYGVDVFFVVSGFIMFYTTVDSAITPLSFFLKRLIRIFPLYFILSTLLYVMVAARPNLFNKASPDVVAYLQSILFIPHWNPRLHDLQPILGPGWTLNYEMFFYLLFALALFFPFRLKALLAIPVIGLLVAAGRLYSPHEPVYLTYTSPLMLEFCMGIVIACTYALSPAAGRRWRWLFLILGVLTLVYLYGFHAELRGEEPFRPLFIGIPCALLLTVMVSLDARQRLPRIDRFAYVGDASYSLYLVHALILGFAVRLWRPLGWNSASSRAAFIALVLMASMAAASMLYEYVETRIGRRLSRALAKVQARRAAPARARSAAMPE